MPTAGAALRLFADDRKAKKMAAGGTGGGPGMAGFKVTPEYLASAATYVDGRSADIEAKINALGSYAESLGVYWTGSAHNAFETLMGDYRTYATMLQNALTDIGSGLRGNYVNYSGAEATNLANIVKVQLPKANF
jgi:WXG100 family type VII secretion target